MLLFCEFVFLLLFSSRYFVANTNAESEKYIKTIHGNRDPPQKPILEFVAQEDEFENQGHKRFKRLSPVHSETVDPSTKVNHLNDTHKQLMVHWVGENSKVVICLARDPTFGLFDFQPSSPSAVYISYDDGDTYVNKTDLFKLRNGSYATLEKFYNHPKYNTHFIFTDIRHNLLFVTTNHGQDFRRIELKFTPSELSFDELHTSTFVILDKNDTQNRLWITEDYGETFREAHEFVKAFFWIKDGDSQSDIDSNHLVVHRYEPSGMGTIIASNNLFRNRRKNTIYATNIKDFFVKGDYLFTTEYDPFGHLKLYVSYKLGRQLLCVFDTSLEIKNFFVADVSGNRAFVAASHSETSSNLYVSDNLGGMDSIVRFTLSIEDVFAYFPNTTWQGTWLHHVSEEAFTDLYKVEGLHGIYIASKVVTKPNNNNLGPQHLGSVITYDHGATWRPIQPPAMDIEGQSTGCLVSKGCSLHLSQKFSQLYPESRSVTILTSKSAPGIIIATGVLGNNLKGHYGVYISVDAGLSWRQTLRELYFFNMGDHGGVLSAVKYYKSKGETRHILYSIDEGETWNQTKFHNEEIRLYGLMTEPGENTTVFTMFGSLPSEHRWIIVKVDFANVFKYECKPEDYKMWSPSQSEENRSYIPCILGEQTTYQRRMRHAPCLNGLDYVRMVSKKPCDCDVLDFECDFGFKKVTTNKIPRCIQDKNLISFDPYKAPINCPPGQFYPRTKGYRKISGDKCVQGFEYHYLPDIVPCPFKEVDDFLLFAQRENISRYNLMTGTLEPLPIKHLKNVIAIDFDMDNNCVYWADINLDTINRQCFTNGSKLETLVSSDLASIEGMAFDWISKTLYFVDGTRSKIELIRTDINHSGRMRKTILDGKVLKKPRGIAVHPLAGYMFWTDWSAENPSVNRANLDGTNNLTLFGKDRVEWPNGITVDYIANRIYWVDARQDYIGSSDLHGDGFLKVVHDAEVVSHPFAVAVFKSSMYWDDWKKNAIYRSDKDIYKGINVVIKDMEGLMDLKVYAHGIQIGKNACANASCPYICVGLPKSRYACLCPDGMIPAKDGGCLCPGNVPALNNGTCPLVDNSCSTEHFACRNGVCVPKAWKCDGEDDCGDNSDEARCDGSTCPPTFHVCGDGKCLPHYWRCDYDTDCADGSDELNCPRQNCTDSQYACDNGRCISRNWRCDGENDCRDNSDERNCDPDRPTQCKGEDEFQCKSGAVTCIPSTWKCDDEPDCRDGSDESDCSNNTCTEAQFACGPPNNRCIFKTWVCDGDKDCPDGRDEVNCTSSKLEPTKPPGSSIFKNLTCQEWMFKCHNDRCIPFWWKCDEVDDCGDGSDELGCATTSPIPIPMPTPTRKPGIVICEGNQFRCRKGQCIMASWVCDGSFDCPDGEDEQHCDGTFLNCSSPNQFRCRIDGSCIPTSQVCDGVINCPDHTDEATCDQYIPNDPATPSCSVGFFPCDGGTCNPLSVMCDGRKDCNDGYDEKNCTKTSRIYQVMQMGIDMRGTDYNTILLHWAISPVTDVKLEFMPSINKVGENKWRNESWVDESEYQFKDLQPYTKYNMTVYVRDKNTKIVFPPARYFVGVTQEGIPSPPFNVTAKQQNGSHILVSWNKPAHPNGIIINYQIIWIPEESAPIRLRLSGNETSHLLSADFQHNRTYSFVVTAFNRRFESNHSAPARLVFDGETTVNRIKDLQVTQVTNTSVSLSWSYNGEFDGFSININAESDKYPVIPPYKTKSKNYTIKLAPGVIYIFKVYAFRNGLNGPYSLVSATTLGSPLPAIEITQAITVKDIGTTVKLSWERPEKYGKVAWTYGVYYGMNPDQLTSPSVFRTPNLTATISHLDACETYMFAVGIVGPYGFGPLSDKIQFVTTSSNPKAPPKNLQVKADDQDPLKMFISWQPSCSASDNTSYTISVTETTTKKVWNIKVSKKLSHNVQVENGGVYSVRVSTSLAGATYTKPVVYKAPPILPPFEISVLPEINGSYFVYWSEHDVKPNGPFSYEVLVQEGTKLNESSAQKFLVDRPPFIYTNDSASVYTFAVRIKTAKGYSSMMSEALTKLNQREIEPSSINLPAVIIPSFLVLLTLIGIVGFLVIRNRRLHNSFVRFANSHYSSRSGAATFDDHSLEEEESPRIVGFSDDEPLVVA